MRILALNWQDRKHPLAGGAEVHLHEILSRLGRDGHAITLVCSQFEGGAASEEYDNMRVMRSGGRNTFNWTLPGVVRDLMRTEEFDVVIDDINKIPFAALDFTKLPVLAIVHHLFGAAIFREVNAFAAAYVYLMEWLVPRRYHDVPIMAVSESTRDDLIARGVDRDLIRVVHNGIDHDRYYADPAVPESAHPTIVYVGRLKKYKSIDHLIAATKTLHGESPDLSVHIIGAGDDKQRLEQVAAKAGLAGVIHFEGFLEFDDKVNMLRRAWVVCCPSLKEGWGLTNIEANACGTPVVCANVPGLRDSVRDNRTGLLYPYGDVDALTDRLRAVLRDSSLRGHLREGALAWATRFHWERTATETMQILERITQGDSRIGRGGISAYAT